MATTVTSTKPRSRSGFGGGPKSPGPNGNGSRKRNGHSFTPEFYRSRYRVGMWVALAAILMMFTALTSAYIVRGGGASDWVPLAMPRILLFSTALIIVSSATLESARRKLREAAQAAYKRRLLITVVLGIGFLASQLFAWRQLIGQGIYVSSNPHSSFFYLLTATHGAHLLGGLLVLIYLTVRTHANSDSDVAEAKRQAAADAAALYWHFMAVLWIYLFVLLFYWK